jgi:nitroreductase
MATIVPPPRGPPSAGTLAPVELRDAVLHRRMVRRFDPGRPVPAQVVRDLVGLGVRAPSAGFSQGWDFVALLDPADRAAFWAATDDGTPPDAWRRGVEAAPALVLCLSDPGAYLDRYAEPDKGWIDRSTDRWPVPYWDTDTAMAAMILLLGAQEAGLGALFFGVPADRHDAVREAHGIPAGRRLVAVVALGHEAERVSGSARTRRRRALDEVLHVGRFGEHGVS